MEADLQYQLSCGAFSFVTGDSTTWLKVFFASVDEILLKRKQTNRFK